MELLFYLSGAVAIVATVFMLTRSNAVHALIDLVVSLLAVALVFYSLGAPFAAALEVIVYAGAIMVLFLFAVMLPAARDTTPVSRGAWIPSCLLAVVLAIELIVTAVHRGGAVEGAVGPKLVGIVLFGPYLIGVELASVLLLAGMVGAFHIGRPEVRKEAENAANNGEERSDSGSDLVLAGTDRPAGKA